MTDMQAARDEATQELCSALLKAAGDVMTRHGADPNSGVILAAGFGAALRAIGEKIDRRVPMVVREMLESPSR